MREGSNGQLTGETLTPSGGTAKSVGYSYYDNGQLETITTYENESVTFAYDALLRPESQTDPKDGGGTITFAHDDRSRLTSTTYPSGLNETRAYTTKADRLASITLKNSSSTVLQSYGYDYGITSGSPPTRSSGYTNGKLLSVTERDGSVESYTYGTSFPRLKTAQRTGTAAFYQEYQYDLNDDRTGIRYNSSGTWHTTSYDGANQIVSADGVGYTWDKNGNLKTLGSDTLGYDAADRWTTGTIGGTSAAYKYDGHGRRVERTDNGTDTTKFWYDQRGMSYETGTTAATYDLALDGTALSVYAGSTLNDLAHDRLRSSRNLVSTGQSITKTVAYDPSGLTTLSSGSPYVGFRWTGVYKDVTTGFYRMHARSYQPASGRFTQLDPLPKSILSWNRYEYASCDPIDATDRSGLDSCPEAQAAAAAGLAALGVLSAGLGAAAIFLAPSVIGELALLPAEAADLYLGYLFTEIINQGNYYGCSDVLNHVDLNPF